MMLVTGGAGFIGSHLVERLSRDHEVAVIDDLSTGRLRNLKGFRDRITLHRMSILDGELKKALRDVEVIFHHAAQINVRSSVENPGHDLDVNAKGTLNLLESARDLEKFIYASSGGAVYGEPEYLPVDEEHKVNPLSPYGVSKLAGEKYVECYAHNYGIKTAILRYSNVYGERQDAQGEAGVISIFLDRVSRGLAPVVFGDGEQTRDFVYVGDVVNANLPALEREGTFNIATGRETSVNELIRIIARITKREIKPVYDAPRRGEVKKICLDITRAKEKLGWAPETTLEKGIGRLI